MNHFTWGVVCRPKQGQSVSGDVFVVQTFGENNLLASVIDGLGGGVEAAHAAKGAAVILQEWPHYPLNDLIQRTHKALHNTRGAVIAILRLDPNQHVAEFIGVGNIGIQVYSQQAIKPISKNGILGYRLPTLLQLRYYYDSGDTFVLYSDGISNRFSLEGKIDAHQHPQTMAEAILTHYGKMIDDATVVVIRDRT